MVQLGTPMAMISLYLLEEEQMVCISSMQISTLTKMVGIALTKVMERSISSLMNQLNGTIRTTMDLGTTLLLHSNPIHVCLLGATLLKTDLVVQMQMVMDGLTKETYGRLTQNNGPTLTWMDMEITTSMMLIISYSMLTREEMRSLTIQANGTTLMETGMEITLPTTVG